MTDRTSVETVSIHVPAVSGQEAASATDLVERLVEKYHLSADDADALFAAVATIFVRNRMVYGDRPPTGCAFAECREKE